MFTGSVAVAFASACSVALAVDEHQCERDADCKARGSAFKNTHCSEQFVCVKNKKTNTNTDDDPRFACANDEPASIDTSREVGVEIRFADSATGSAPSDLAVRLCATTDPNCEAPRSTLSGETSDEGDGYVKLSADGALTGTVEYGFEGFFETTGGGYDKTLRYTSPPLSDDSVFDQILLKSSTIDEFAGLLGSEFKRDTHGLVFVLAHDCERAALSGVRFTVDNEDDSTVPFYVINTAPSTTADKTDALGRAGFLNVPPGITLFTAEWADTGEPIGSASVVVRAGAVTTVAVLPSP